MYVYFYNLSFANIETACVAGVLLSLETRTHLTYIVDGMAADDLAVTVTS